MNTHDRAPLVRLDWRAYFKEFCELHGRDPVSYRGRLLFPDGWTYSSSDYAGPEWPPPDDPAELLAVQSSYWRRRRGIVRRERDELRLAVQSLAEMQRCKSVPLQQVVQMRDSETNQRVTSRKPLDLDGLKARLAWLEEDVAECDRHLAELGEVDEPQRA